MDILDIIAVVIQALRTFQFVFVALRFRGKRHDIPFVTTNQASARALLKVFLVPSEADPQTDGPSGHILPEPDISLTTRPSERLAIGRSTSSGAIGKS